MTEQKIICKGWLPDDYSDISDITGPQKTFAKTASKILIRKELGRENVHIIPEYTPISNQGGVGTCVANAGMDMFEILMGVEAIQLSRMFANWIARSLVGGTTQDNGTSISALMFQTKMIGAVEEKYLPYKATFGAITTPPALDMYTMASENRIKETYKITATGIDKRNEIMAAIAVNHPVAFGMKVSKDFLKYKGGTEAWNSMDGEIAGGHAMLLTGWRKINNRIEFLDRNSWGIKWGNNGYCWMGEDLVIEASRDLHVGTLVDWFE